MPAGGLSSSTTGPHSGVQKQHHVLPVTLLSGFLGSGKTSLLTHILHNREGLRVAVIMNEISEVNIDVVAIQGTKLLKTEEKIVEMSNGCVCCTLREDLLLQLRALHQQQAFDAVLIESSGIAEPMQTAETFFLPPPQSDDEEEEEEGENGKYDDEEVMTGEVLNTVAPLDNCVTVVDASTLRRHMHNTADTTTMDKKAVDEANGVQSIAELLFDQLEFANVVLLNKIDLLIRASAHGPHSNDPKTVAALAALKEYDAHFADVEQNSKHTNEFLQKILPVLAEHPVVQQHVDMIRQVNPRAVIIPACNGCAPLNKILRTGFFSPEFATSMDGWMEDVRSGVKHVPETLEYGVGAFYYSAHRPFHPERFYNWLEDFFVVKQMVPDMDEEEEDLESNSDSPSDHDEEDDENENETEEEQVDGEEEDGGDIDNDNDEEEINQKQVKRLATYGNLFRGKGFVWIGNPKRLDSFGQVSLAGNVLNLTYGGRWGEFPELATPSDNKPTKTERVVAKRTDACHGPYQPNHKAQEMLVFIGQNLNKEALRRDLDACLVTDEEWASLCKHMDTAIVSELERISQHRKKKWRDRAWLNDEYEDYFEEFPLPLSPCFEGCSTTLPSPVTAATASKKPTQRKRTRDDEW